MLRELHGHAENCEIWGPQNTVPKTKIAFGSSLWLRFALRCELRNSQPQSVLRFCVFGGQGCFGLTKKSQKPFVTGRFVATNHRGPVPKVTSKLHSVT